jgi:predicted house-cleaning noncanonical NTP pyrophosphatase (MazG superfamily)
MEAKCYYCGLVLDVYGESPADSVSGYHHPMESVMDVPKTVSVNASGHAHGASPKEDGGTGYAPGDDPNYRYRGEEDVDARDINSMLHRTLRACEFYMHLHRDKGGWQDYRSDYCWESIFRNLHEAFKEDRIAGVMLEKASLEEAMSEEFGETWQAQKREAMAELVGIINHVAILLDIYYKDELEELTDWLPLRDQIVGKDQTNGS